MSKQILTTRLSDIASTIRASVYKQGSRNLIENFLNGRGYEGIVEISTDKKGGDEMTNEDILAVGEELRKIVERSRKGPIGITIHENGDMRPYRADDPKKGGIAEMQVNAETNVANTVTTAHMPKTYGESTNLRIRKLTPTECYKLMGFTAEDCNKASEAGISNAQLYKQAGNSIVVNVLEAIFTSLGERYREFEICK